jgi:hypothetical protein
MRTRLALYLVGLCLVCQGCSPLAHAARGVIIQPIRYPRRLDDLVDCMRNKKLANAAWAQYQADHMGTDFSCDFALGFKEGYEDFLYAGGSGEPPPVPPRYYWRPEFESPAGQQAVRDWFAGFRAGAAAARQSGHRNLVVVPASTALSPSLPSSPQQQESASPPRQASPAGEEMLPAPRPVPAAPGVWQPG